MANKRQRKKNAKKKIAAIQEQVRYLDKTKAPNQLVEELEALKADTEYLKKQVKSDDILLTVYNSIIQRIEQVVNIQRPRKERAIRKPTFPKIPKHIEYKDELPADEEVPFFTATDLKPRRKFYVPPKIENLQELLEVDEQAFALMSDKFEEYIIYVNDSMDRHQSEGFADMTDYQAKGMYIMAIKTGGFSDYVKEVWAENKDRPIEDIKAIYSEGLPSMLEAEKDEYHSDDAEDTLNIIQGLEAEQLTENDEREAKQYVKQKYNLNKGRKE